MRVQLQGRFRAVAAIQKRVATELDAGPGTVGLAP